MLQSNKACCFVVQGGYGVALKQGVLLFAEIFKFMLTAQRTYSPIFRTWNGSMPQIHLQKPEDVEVRHNGRHYLLPLYRPQLTSSFVYFYLLLFFIFSPVRN
jgi:hypothetical protein